MFSGQLFLLIVLGFAFVIAGAHYRAVICGADCGTPVLRCRGGRRLQTIYAQARSTLPRRRQSQPGLWCSPQRACPPGFYLWWRQYSAARTLMRSLASSGTWVRRHKPQ
jgi:hypothetical protein